MMKSTFTSSNLARADRLPNLSEVHLYLPTTSNS
jgi:hypothetical protein